MRGITVRNARFTLTIFLVWLISSGIGVIAQDQPAHTNRLINETSPYLRLHAQNPVDWYPWGEEALQRAKAENKPIFLSIGYSSCHWCHVMERLVFENEEIAKYMNEHFINIKVDREERPDLDDIYMLSLQVYQQLAGSSAGGGWPLSMFLTPDGTPIAGGTYFPPEDMPGRPGFPKVMQQITQVWTTRREDVVRTADIIAREVKRLSTPQLVPTKVELNASLVQKSVEAVRSSYDPEHAGLDFNPREPDGPKFPVPSKILLLQSQIGRGENASEEKVSNSRIVDHTLERLARGGIHDHLGGGFHRYSTDREWLVPHFEKMLYDNAQLLEVYAEAFRRTSQQSYRRVAEDIVEFLARDMTSPTGGFYSALDAETEGVEGLYYVWSSDELSKSLQPTELKIFGTVYGLDRPQTFEHGRVLYEPRTIAESAQQLGMSIDELRARLAPIRAKLLKQRQQRPQLLRDEKVITAWNGLTIRALARAGQILQRKNYVAAAEKAAIDLLTRMRNPVSGRLLRTAGSDSKKLDAYSIDYAFLVSGLLALHEATGEDKWLTASKRLTDEQINLFWDREGGGFYFTMHEHESLIARPKAAYDSVMPSANSVSIENLTKLARLTGEEIYRAHAEETLKAFAGQLPANPGGMAYFALALDRYLQVFGEPRSSAPENLFTGGISSPKMETQAVDTKAEEKPASPPANQPLVVQLKPTSDEAGKHDKITTQGFLSVDQLPAGGQCLVAIEVNIAGGWHLNANPPRPDYIIPVELTLKSPEGFELSDIKYPKGHDFKIEGIDEPLSVYEGKVYILAAIKVPASAAGKTDLSLKLKYQACNDINCVRPMSIEIVGQLPVAKSGTEPQASNAALFQKLLSGAKSE